MGRTREFEVDAALCAALGVFREKGYEGASLTALTAAMGITRPSLYAAFGNKEGLFRKALDRYQQTSLGFLGDALAAPDGRSVVERLLHGYADALTPDGQPPGCLATNGALACSTSADPIKRALIARRDAVERSLRDRLERSRRERDLPRGADPASLARFVMTVVHGMSVQAASGAGRNALHDIARMALRACAFGEAAGRRPEPAGA